MVPLVANANTVTKMMVCAKRQETVLPVSAKAQRDVLTARNAIRMAPAPLHLRIALNVVLSAWIVVVE